MRPVLFLVGVLAEFCALLLAVTADSATSWGGALFGVAGGILFFTVALMRIQSDRRQVQEYRDDITRMEQRIMELTAALIDCEQRRHDGDR